LYLLLFLVVLCGSGNDLIWKQHVVLLLYDD
jgi:hypothetical protein